MKTSVICFCLGFLLSTAQASDVQEVYDAHIAWKTASEQASLPAVDAIWTHAPDAMLITLFGVQIKGWLEVRQEIKRAFDLVGKTTITVSNLVITVSGEAASATSDYRWSPIPDLPLKATERYRLEGGRWKMHAQDATGGLEPLRPDDETCLRQKVQQTQAALLGKDLNALMGLIADAFTYIALDGTVHRTFEKAAIGKDVENIRELRLKVIYLTDTAATAHYSLTPVNFDDREIELVYNNDWQLTQVNFKPEAESFAVEPSGKRSTTWGHVKEEK